MSLWLKWRYARLSRSSASKLNIHAGHPDAPAEHLKADYEVLGCLIVGHPSRPQPEQRGTRQQKRAAKPVRLIFLIRIVVRRHQRSAGAGMGIHEFVTENNVRQLMHEHAVDAWRRLYLIVNYQEAVAHTKRRFPTNRPRRVSTGAASPGPSSGPRSPTISSRPCARRRRALRAGPRRRAQVVFAMRSSVSRSAT